MAKKGETLSAEIRQKISKTLKGKPKSAESRRKMSEAWNQDHRGEKNPNHKLSEQDVLAIKIALKDPYWGVQTELAWQYGVKKAAISKIKCGQAWEHIEV